jgi:hypothetical protein
MGQDQQENGGRVERVSSRTKTTRGSILPWATAVLLLGSCGPSPVSWTPAEHVLGPPELVVSLQSGILASPNGLAVDPNGRLYVLDRLDRRVIRITPDGLIDGTMGRPGEGPGELTAPLAFGIDNGDSVRVFDFAKGSVLVFSEEGTFIRQYRVDLRGIPSRIEFGPDGRAAYAGTHPTGQGALIAELDRSGAQTGLLGTLLRDETEIPPDLLDQVHERTIPDFMRNSALPGMTRDGGTWLFLQTEAVLEHFTADRTRDVHQRVEVPEMPTIAEAYFDWYASVQARDMLRYFEYAEDLAATPGSVWILWQTPSERPGLITLHDTRGQLCARLLLQGVGEDAQGPDEAIRPPRRRLAVDENRSRIYVLDQNTAQIWAFAIPDPGIQTSECSPG